MFNSEICDYAEIIELAKEAKQHLTESKSQLVDLGFFRTASIIDQQPIDPKSGEVIDISKLLLLEQAFDQYSQENSSSSEGESEDLFKNLDKY